MLTQLLCSKPINSPADQCIEEKTFSKADKNDLEKLIVTETKKGWMVKSRTHESEGVHGVVMFRRTGLPKSI